nr:SET domain-containing protein [Paraburkholderia caledonica]
MQRPPRDVAQPDYTFCFDIGNGFVIDGAGSGNSARWINHSCAPNCEPELDGSRIFIRAFRDIENGEELSTGMDTEGDDSLIQHVRHGPTEKTLVHQRLPSHP